MLNIGNNFNLNSRLYLDSRQIADSLEALQNKTNVLYPPGFEVYCKAEKKWYQNTADEGATPIWTERPVGTGGGGNANIDDNNIGTDVTYSNQKIENRLSEVNAEVTNVADDLIDMDTRVSYLEEKQLEGAEVDLTIYQTKTDDTLNTTNKTIVGSINEIKGDVDAIEIPTKTSDLTNDSGFLTEHQDLSGYAPINNPNFMNSISMGRLADSTIGENSVALGTDVTASNTDAHAEGMYTSSMGTASHAEGLNTTAIGNYSHIEGNSGGKASDIIENLTADTSTADIITAWESNKFSLAKGTATHVEGRNNLALSNYAHAEGSGTVAHSYAHSEGLNTKASGLSSHAEGNASLSSGISSHAQGNHTTASGSASHAQGSYTIADGYASHAEGWYTTASSSYQHVQGKYNILDTEGDKTTPGKYVHIVGNGTSEDARSNAHTLDWNGNAWYAGKITIGADNKELATQEYVDSVGFTLAKGTEDSPIVLNSLTNGVIYKVVGYYKNIDTSEILSLSKPMYINIFTRNSTSFSYVKFNSTGTNPCGIYVVKLTDGTYTYNSLVRQTQVLTKTNTEEYTPTSDYHPSTKKYVDDESLNVLQKIYNGKVYKIQLTEDEMNGMWSLNEEEYITINNITQDDINNIMEGDIYYSALLINDYIFIIQGRGNSNGVNGITCYSRYESSSYGYIEYYNYKIGTLTTDNSTVVIKKIKAEKYDFNTKIINKAIINNKLILDTNKNQHVSNIVDGTEIVLPTVTDYTEIHLYFDATENLTLTYPSNIIWQQGEPTITSGRTYELIFTYTNKWICEYVEYGADDVEEATDEEINAMLLEIFGGDYSN